MPSLAGKVAFSITWRQLESLRSLPKALPDRGRPYETEQALIDKGLARLSTSGLTIGYTQSGVDLLACLRGLVPPRGHSWHSNT